MLVTMYGIQLVINLCVTFDVWFNWLRSVSVYVFIIFFTVLLFPCCHWMVNKDFLFATVTVNYRLPNYHVCKSSLSLDCWSLKIWIVCDTNYINTKLLTGVIRVSV